MHLLDKEEQLILLYLDKMEEISNQNIDDNHSEMERTKAEGISRCFSKVLEGRKLRRQEFSAKLNKVLRKAKEINLENLDRKSAYEDILLHYEQVIEHCSSMIGINEKDIQLFEKYEQIRREEEIDKNAKHNLDCLVSSHIRYTKSEAEIKTLPPVENVGVTLSPTLQLDDQQKRNTANKVSHIQLYMPVLNEVQNTEVVKELVLKEPNEINVFSIEFDFIDDEISDMRKICNPEMEMYIDITALENDLKTEIRFEEIVVEDVLETKVKYEPNLQRPKMTYMEDFTYLRSIKTTVPLAKELSLQNHQVQYVAIFENVCQSLEVIDCREPTDVRMIHVKHIEHRKRKKFKMSFRDDVYLQKNNCIKDLVSLLMSMAILTWFLMMNYRPPRCY